MDVERDEREACIEGSDTTGEETIEAKQQKDSATMM